MVPVNPKLKALDPQERRLGYEYAKSETKPGINPWVVLFVIILIVAMILIIRKVNEDK